MPKREYKMEASEVGLLITSAGGFLTGSRVYGTPRDDSDYDLVVLVTLEDARKLYDAGFDIDDNTIRFGNLNLILCTDTKSFEVWKKGTRKLKARRPVTRDEAIAEFRKLRTEAGIYSPNYGGLKP